MKQYLLKTTLGIMAALALSAASHAATVWEPTDVVASGNVNVLQFPLPGLELNGGTLALFEDTDVGLANPLVLGMGGGVFDFVDNGGGSFTVTAVVGNLPGGSINMNGDEFVLAVDWGNGYVTDSAIANAGGDMTSFNVSFTDGQNSGGSLVVDVTPVPLPAAAWLLGSALLGLGVVKRKKP